MTPVSSLVLCGSPGFDLKDAADLGLQVPVYSALAKKDWIGSIPAFRWIGFGHGMSPKNPHWGAVQLPTGGVKGHDNYFDKGTQSLPAIAAIVNGAGPDEVKEMLDVERGVRGLIGPLLLILGLWVAFMLTMFGLGLPLTNTIPVAKLLIDPLWFIAVYLVLTVLQPWISRIGARIGWWLPAIAVVLIAISDVLQYFGVNVPGMVIVVTTIAWVIPYVLGIWLREDEGNARRRVRALVVFLVGLIGFTPALTVGPYPQSMVGVNGANSLAATTRRRARAIGVEIVWPDD